MSAITPTISWKSRWEAAAWLYMRLSGIMLLFLVLGHMLWMHVLVGVDGIDFGFVVARWSGLGWRLYDFAMLWLALSHGAIGVRGVTFDIPTGLRRAALFVCYAACLLVALLGSWVILTFASPV